MSPLDATQARTLLDAAREAAAHHYAPYSRYAVGAALLTDQGEIIAGANIENISYGLTLCAERVAIACAVSRGLRTFSAIAVWAQEESFGAVTPCGACRQTMAEFMTGETLVISADGATGALRQTLLGDLLPDAFQGKGLTTSTGEAPC
ncbi:MAG: cytidine deaminase [Vampirovibrionales bacterium]|nr:cytidine deaminase [Vampirovibrionales bacterium]